MIALSIVLALSQIFGQARASGAAPSDLAAAKALYASASYEEALARLSTIGSEDDEVQIEQYRALCLLALGRPEEATRALERLVVRRPLFTATEEDISPRLVELLHEVRKRLLPDAARTVYADARTAFDGGDYARAADGFKQLLAIVDDPDTDETRATLADLKQLGEGFLKLATAAAAPAPTPTPSASTPTPAPTPTAGPPPAADVTYSSEDADVTSPVPIDATMPVWAPRDPAIARLEFRGILEVVVDENGRVFSAAIRKSIVPAYDAALLDAVKTWRFKPAMRQGVAVRYRRFTDVVLRPGGANRR